MALHRLSSISIGVPDVTGVSSYYADFGLTELASGRFATQDGGEQLRVEYAPTRRLLGIDFGVDDPEDLDRIAGSLARFGITPERTSDAVAAVEPVTQIRVSVRVADHLTISPTPLALYNRAGHVERVNDRAAGILRTYPVRPRKLGHVVVGSTDAEASRRFFTDGIGLKVSDEIPGLAAFLRCSTDHHNVLVQAAPVSFLHHTAWEVNDIDDVGRGAMAMLEDHPERHVWGLGRHHIGSNFFWYLRDPAGNFAEYYSDLDEIVDEQLWKPEVVQGARGLFNWGPPPPASFIHPEDLAGLMTGAHSDA